ncbi:hypothetical protein [uncultured Psychrobacter sp.]|uniref:hypothetical protein n=1 Tax=uncultured Psychrobacter sp. TaxID=259303 RepID=UPI0030DCC31C
MNIIDYKALGDQNERFLVGMLDSDNNKLYSSLYEYLKQTKDNEDTRALGKLDDVLGAPYGRILKDTVSGREFAVILHTDLKKGTVEEPGMVDIDYETGLLLGEIKDNEIVGTPATAAKALGLPNGLSFDIERYCDNGYTIEDQIRDSISVAQQPLLKSEVRALPDARALLDNQIRFNGAINDYLDKQKALLPYMEANYNSVMDSIKKGDKPTPEGEKSLKARKERIERDKELVFKAIITPEKFELDAGGYAVPVDVDALNNRFANTTQDSTIPLGDVRGEFNIGKVSQSDKENSLVVGHHEQIVSAIRVVTSKCDGYTNLYAVQSGDEYWLRAEHRQAGSTTMENEAAFANIGLNANKFVVGGDTSAYKVMSQINPAALRETIIRQGLLDYAIQNKVMGYEHPVTEHKALDWASKNNSNDYGGVLVEFRTLDAQKVDNRTTVVDLSAKQVQQLEDFSLIREAGYQSNKGYEYVGGASGYIIIDHKYDITQVIGQTIIHTDRNDDDGFKKVEAISFDIALRPDRPGVQYPYYGVSPARIKLDLFLAAHNEDNNGKTDPLPGSQMHAQFQGNEVYAFGSRRYSGKNVLEAIAQSDAIQLEYDAKILNNFGCGIKHPSIVKLEQMEADSYSNLVLPVDIAQDMTGNPVDRNP